MTIRRVMKTQLVVAKAEMPLATAVRLLIDHRISGLPVTDDDRRIVGVLTEKDLLGLYAADGECRVVADLMTRNPRCIHVDAPLVDVFDCLMSNSFRRVLIHDDGRLVGIVSRADVLPAILDVLLDRTR